MMPPARNSPVFLRAKCRVIDGRLALRRRVRRRSTASAAVCRLLSRRVAGRDRPWQDKQMRMSPRQVPANAWSLWGLPCQIKQRLFHLGKLPKRHAKIPISMWARDGIGRKHSSARFMEFMRAASEREARCDAILARLAARLPSATDTQEQSHG